MSINEILNNSIVNQFAANIKLNLLYQNIDFQNHFLEETKNTILNLRHHLLEMDQEKAGKWIEIMTDKALKTFYENNQYIDSRIGNVSELQKIYQNLWGEIIEELQNDEIDFEKIQKSHLNRLTQWIIATNGFVKEINDPLSPTTREVACSEYSAEFQLKLLEIDCHNILEPVLDIGCGENAYLVNYLRDNGIQAYGLDRLCPEKPFLIKADWLDFDFQPHAWGTIISNLSFALHFTHHHHRKDSDYIFYARKYMEILNSLKCNGSFYYAPGLPFMEAYLPKDKFKTLTNRINSDFSHSCITCIIA